MHAADVTNVLVLCEGPAVTIGGTVEGLNGDAMVLQLNGDPDSNLVLSADASFELDTTASCGSPYWTSIVTLPGSQQCVIRNGLGTARRNEAPVQVECYAQPPEVGAPQRLSLTDSGGVQFATYSDSNGYHYERRTASLGPDTTLSTEGYVQLPIGGSIQTGARDFAVLSDGSIVAAGNGDGIEHCPGDSQHDLTLVKWLQNGTPDPAFGGGDGYIQDNFYGVCDSAYDDETDALVVQSSGRIVVGGSAYDGSTFRGVLRGFTAQGALDTTFGDSGRHELDLPLPLAFPLPGPITKVRRIVRTSDDRMWVLACQEECGIVARYTADAELDSSVAPTHFNERLANPLLDLIDFHAMEIDDEGRIWLGGRSLISNVPTLTGTTKLDRAVLVRMTAAGVIDSTFGEDGMLYLELPLQDKQQSAGVSSIHFTSQGDAVIGGAYIGHRTGAFGVAFMMRLDEDGRVDTSFGRDGVITSHPNGEDSFDRSNAGITAVVSAPNGDLFSARGYYGDGRMRFLLERN